MPSLTELLRKYWEQELGKPNEDVTVQDTLDREEPSISNDIPTAAGQN